MPDPIPMLTLQQGTTTKEIVWDQSTLSIGRDTTNDIVIEHRLASRRHARFERDAAGFYVRDLESTNGTFVNGEKIEGAHLLHTNDEVWIGDTIITFRDPEATVKGTPPPIVRQPSLPPQEALRVDTRAKDVYLRGTMVEPPLTAKEFQLLELLYTHKGEVLSKDQIAKAVWDYEVYDFNAIDALVYRLRHRIEIDPANPRHLVTVRGFGYKLLTDE